MEGSPDLQQQFADSQTLAHVGSWEWDASREQVWWSDELCRIYGHPPGLRPTSQQGFDFVHPQDRARVENVLAQTCTGDLQFRIIRPDGVVRHVLARWEVRRDEHGTILSRYGVILDITDRHGAETARDRALGMLETAFSHSAVGMSLVDTEGRWVQVNDAMCRITGWSREELLQRTFQEITHPDDVAADEREVQRALAGEIDEFQLEKRYLTRTGGDVWTLLSVTVIRDEDGTPQHFLGQVQDISDRKRAEQRLREAEAEARRERDHAQAIIAAMHEGYALTVDSEVIAVNEAICEMLGYSESELVGLRPPYPFWDDDARRIALDAGRRVMEEGTASCEVTAVRRDGTPFEVEISVRAARGENDEIIGFVHTWRDVSERNRLQRELERRARTDSLTGLANRYVLQEALALEARRHARGQTLALVLLDLDRFKLVNDRHGHPVGDAVLCETARRLSSVVREGEVIARVGGEEFAWLLPDCDAVGARAAANRARAMIGERPFADAGSLTMSAGIAVTEIPCDATGLYELADRALYDAKQAGRDRTRCRAQASETLDESGRRLDAASRASVVDLLTGAAQWGGDRRRRVSRTG